MITYGQKIDRFLKLKNIAVTGVSSTKKNPANYIFKKFKEAGYTVFAINKNGTSIDGFSTYATLKDVPGSVDGVVLASPPDSAIPIVDDCIKLGIQFLWIHSSIDKGSFNAEAKVLAEKNNIEVIPVGCPMMYVGPVDIPHKCIKWILKLTGKIPGK